MFFQDSRSPSKKKGSQFLVRVFFRDVLFWIFVDTQIHTWIRNRRFQKATCSCEPTAVEFFSATNRMIHEVHGWAFFFWGGGWWEGLKTRNLNVFFFPPDKKRGQQFVSWGEWSHVRCQRSLPMDQFKVRSWSWVGSYKSKVRMLGLYTR